MNIRLKPCRFCGEVTAISSKSDAHRLLIASALSDRPTFIRCNARSADITATVNCLNSLGADIKFVDGGISVKPIKEKEKVPYSIVMRAAQPSDFTSRCRGTRYKHRVYRWRQTSGTSVVSAA